MTQTPISSGLMGRITQAARYVISGVAPDGWFGPMQPLQPMAPPDVAGRRFDYPTGYNLTYTPRGAEPVSFSDLRALADSCDILRSVIETRKDQIEAQQWTVRVTVGNNSSHIPLPTDDQKRRIDSIVVFLQSPDKERGFDQWLRQILEDMFVIDGVAVYKRRNRAGGLYALEIIDAATIKILLDDGGRLPVAPDPAYQQVLKGVPAADYTREELMYLVHNPRSHKVYGYSHVEQVLVTVNILIRRSLHQLEYYREGSSPDALIGLPKEWTNDQIVAFQKHFDAMLSGNLGLRRRVRFMPGDFKYQETKAPPLKDAYDEFLARIICFVFSISPEPFVGQVNRATAETSHSRAVDEGLGPLMRFVSAFMNRIIATEFASPDLEFAWVESRAQNPAEAASIDVAYVGAGILTVDEVRANMGLAPIAKPADVVNKYNPHHDERGRFAAVSNATTSASIVAVSSAISAGRQVKDNPQYHDDAIDSDPIGGVLIPAFVAAGAIGLVGTEIVVGADATATTARVGNTVSASTIEPIENVYDWKLGDFKSEQRWQNQMTGRGWTLEEIDETIANGEQAPAPNRVHPENTATKYIDPKTGKSLVRDDITKEILHIGKAGYDY